MDLYDVEHYSTMLSGCESINKGDYKSDAAMYATAVLKLHANDAGLYAGQEGFLDAIKAGAKKTKEWLEKLLTAIKKFFDTMMAKIKGSIKVALHGGNEKFAMSHAKTSFGTLKSSITTLGNTANGMYKKTLEESGYHSKIEDLIKDFEALDKLLDENSPNAKTFLSKLNGLLDACDGLRRSMNTEYNKLKNNLGDKTASDYTKKNNFAEDLGWAAVTVGQCGIKLAEATDKWAKKVNKEGSGNIVQKDDSKKEEKKD